MRIDKFLWCIRLFKTRSLATDACKKGKVKLNQNEIKPAVEVKLDDVVSVRRPPIWRSYRIIDVPKSRVAAKLLPDLIKEETTWQDLETLEITRRLHADTPFAAKGRPTKKQRRDMDRLKGN